MAVILSRGRWVKWAEQHCHRWQQTPVQTASGFYPPTPPFQPIYPVNTSVTSWPGCSADADDWLELLGPLISWVDSANWKADGNCWMGIILPGNICCRFGNPFSRLAIKSCAYFNGYFAPIYDGFLMSTIEYVLSWHDLKCSMALIFLVSMS